MQKLKGEALTKRISGYLLENGAVSVGFSTKETLQDSHPCADITYLMESGRSAVSFVVPLNREYLRCWLAKEDRLAHQREQVAAYVKIRDLSDGVAEMLRGKGYGAIGTTPNATLGRGPSGGPQMDDATGTAPSDLFRRALENVMNPEISHRYLAVASGAGSFGWSGNVGVKGYGSAVFLGTTITDAELEPTSPLSDEENFCCNCKACVGACPMEMFSAKEAMAVTLGGREYTHAARIDFYRCFVCCGGSTGLHKSKEWSSWSPGRFEVPEDHDGLVETHMRASEARGERIPLEGGGMTGQYFSADTAPGQTDKPAIETCGMCSFVCTGDKKENIENLKILQNSGCVIQYPDGSIKVLPPDEAEEEFNRFPPEHRALYC